MKKLHLPIILAAIACVLAVSCGSDEPDNTPKPASGTTPAGTPSSSSADNPYINESSIECDIPNMVITFQASPNKGSVAVFFRRLTNCSWEHQSAVSRYNAKNLYYVKLSQLLGGSQYAFHVLGFDQYGQEIFRSAERTFELPKSAPPAAPILSGLQVFAPSSHTAADGYVTGLCLTTAMEYSVDEGATWSPVTEAGAIRQLPSGKILVRLAETPTAEASREAFIVIPKYKSNTDIDGDGGTSQGLRSPRK